ncbi:hypothetical protein [Butyrivibrio sp. VCD2006]|uniref:hypothetical protein n=1 Tax=Butyrivibrio sp. VCD2006 TaxID=1280664 RepID=UPI0004181FDA|nr:hypothetical protein [Butyrivibrio sp. VCD2006]
MKKRLVQLAGILISTTFFVAGCGTPTASTSSNEVESAASNNEREYIEADVTNEGAVSEPVS